MHILARMMDIRRRVLKHHRQFDANKWRYVMHPATVCDWMAATIAADYLRGHQADIVLFNGSQYSANSSPSLYMLGIEIIVSRHVPEGQIVLIRKDTSAARVRPVLNRETWIRCRALDTLGAIAQSREK